MTEDEEEIESEMKNKIILLPPKNYKKFSKHMKSKSLCLTSSARMRKSF